MVTQQYSRKGIRTIASILPVFCLSACVSTQFTAVAPGEIKLETLTLQVGDAGWNRAPGTLSGFLHKGSEMWTRDGVLLDRVIILDGIGNGQTLFKAPTKETVYPAFRSNMLPNEIEELTVGSLTTLFGASSLVESSGLRPARLPGQRAALFDLTIASSEAPKKQGRTLAFVADGRLYMLLYIAAELHYFERNWESAQALMQSAKVATSPAAAR